MMRRGILSVLVAALAAIALSACAGMPTTGPVTVGLGSGDVDDSFDVSFSANHPAKGATPEEIVNGFLAAATSPDGGWAVAREFLAPALAKTWDPTAGVTIDSLASRELVVASDESVTLMHNVVSDVDATGSYTESDEGRVPLPFALAKQSDGEWRITKADNGIVLDLDFFPQIYKAFSLMFFDPTWTYLVPDIRWFPRNNAASRIVTQLIDGGASPWLHDAVKTAFTEGISAPGAVPRDDNGVAQVELPVAALGLSSRQLSRMQAQLEASLQSAGIGDAVMTVGSVDIDATPAVTRSTRVDASPAVLTKDGFGLLSGGDLELIPGISQGMGKLVPVGIELGPDQDVAAVRVDGGAVVRLRDDQKSVVIDDRAGLINPTVDGAGYIWSVPAGKPGALLAFAPDGTKVAVADAWSGAARISAMELSRDGTRIVGLVTTGGRSEVWVSAVVHNSEGDVPVRLGDPVRLTVLPGAGVDIGWLDDATVGIVSSVDGDDVVLTQQIGGTRTTANAPKDITTIVGGNQLTGARLAASDGTLYARTGTRWQSSATGILVLATQQGSPH